MTQNLLFTLFVLIGTVVLVKVANYIIKKTGNVKKVSYNRIYYVSKFSHFIIYLLTLMALSVVWNVQFGGITVMFSSIFAVIGVALFAQWSILSNITASIIIFFNFPARVGDNIKILDGDNSIIGEIKEISLFNLSIIDEDKNIVLYPNSIFVQKPIIKLNKKNSKNIDYDI